MFIQVWTSQEAFLVFGGPGLWSVDFTLGFSLESPDSRSRPARVLHIPAVLVVKMFRWYRQQIVDIGQVFLKKKLCSTKWESASNKIAFCLKGKDEYFKFISLIYINRNSNCFKIIEIISKLWIFFRIQWCLNLCCLLFFLLSIWDTGL